MQYRSSSLWQHWCITTIKSPVSEGKHYRKKPRELGPSTFLSQHVVTNRGFSITDFTYQLITLHLELYHREVNHLHRTPGFCNTAQHRVKQFSLKMQKEWWYFNCGYKDGIKLANQIKYWKNQYQTAVETKYFIEKEKQHLLKCDITMYDLYLVFWPLAKRQVFTD